MPVRHTQAVRQSGELQSIQDAVFDEVRSVKASRAFASILELPGASSGRHLRQGLKPAEFAAAALGKKEQF